MRRSKSHADLHAATSKPITAIQPSFRSGIKRTNTTIDHVPTKRLRAGPITSRALNIKTQEKKNAIISTFKSNALVTSQVKKTLIKSNSAGTSLSSIAARPPPPLSKSGPASKAAPAPTARSKPKIPPYDFKARFLDLKEKYDAMKAQNDEQKEQIISLEQQTENFDTRERELLEMIQRLEFELFEATDAREKLENEVLSMRKVNNSLTIKNNALATDLSAKSEDLKDTKYKLSELTNKHDKQTTEFDELKQCSGTLKRDFKEASEKLQQSQDQLYQINIERMALHNMVLDLRGNIRVFARVRPPLPSEEERMLCGWSFNDESSLEIHNNELVPSTGTRKQTKHDFTFDQVFDPNTAQEDIFDMVSPLIQSAMDGYNICIFGMFQFVCDSFHSLTISLFHSIWTNG
jgi:kinesin family protein C1